MSKIKSAIYGFIVGDALGVPVEFYKRESLKDNPVFDMVLTNRSLTRPGYWSDDTAMVLCTMQSIIDKAGIDYRDIAEKFLNWFRYGYMSIDNKCFGIGQTTMQALMHYSKNKELEPYETGMVNEKSNGNGSLMRILPIVIYLYNSELDYNAKLEVVNKVSSITHRHKIARLGCVIYTLFVWNLLDGVNKHDAYNEVVNEIKKLYSEDELSEYNRIIAGRLENLNIDQILSTGYVVNTLEASLWAFLKTDNYKDCVLTCVNLGGDTDTIAAISGALAGIYYGIDDIPIKWIETLIDKERIGNIINEFNNCLVKERNENNE